MTSATAKTDRRAEEERLLDCLANNNLGNDTNNNDDDDDDDDNDDHRTIASDGGDTWVTIKSTGTSPLDKSIVSPPLLSESVDQSLTNDLASAMAYALNMPTAREITEVLQDMYILPDYRMANDDEDYSDVDDYSVSSSEYEHARRQRKLSAKNTRNTKFLGRRRRSQFRSHKAMKSTRAAVESTGHQAHISKGRASRKKAQSPSLSKNNGDRFIGIRIMVRKMGKNTKREVQKRTVPKPFVKKTPIDNGNRTDGGKAVNFGFFIPGLSVPSSAPSTSIGLDASDSDDLLPGIDDFITSYGTSVEKTIADIKSAVDAVTSADANDMAYTVLGRPALPDVPPSSRSNKKGRNDSPTCKLIASKCKKNGTAGKVGNPTKIELLGVNRPSFQPNDESDDGRGTKLAAWSQKKLKATSLAIKSVSSVRSKCVASKSLNAMEGLIASRHKMYRFKIGRCFDRASEVVDAGIAASSRSSLRFGQRSSASHDSVPVETNIDSDDEMINHRARITVTRPSTAVHLDPDNSLLHTSTDTPIGINCDEAMKASHKQPNALVESQANEKEGPCGTDEGNTDVPTAYVQVKSTLSTKWTKAAALFRSSLSKMQRRMIQQVPVPRSTTCTDADADTTGVSLQMDKELVVKIAVLADELYDDSLSPSMSILRATKIIERCPENIERLVVSLERRVKEKKSASITTKAAEPIKKTPKKMSTLLDLTSLTDGTEDLSSPDTSPSSKRVEVSSATTIVSNVVEGIEKYGEAIKSLLGPFGEEVENCEQGRRNSEGSSSFNDDFADTKYVTDDTLPLTSVEHVTNSAKTAANDLETDVSMGEEIGIEVNLSAVKLDESADVEGEIDVEMNISFSNNEGVEIYFDIDDDAVTDKIRPTIENENFLRELSSKLELYMRLEAIYGKAETEERAQRRLQAVLQRFEGREQVVLLALRRQMELHAQSSIDDTTSVGMRAIRKPKPPITKTKRIEDRPIQKDAKQSLFMDSSYDGVANLHVSMDDDIYDADTSADLDNLLLGGPVEIYM